MEHLLIIGGVAAGATAAARARRLSPTSRITLLEAGPDISFANCGLPYFIGGDIRERSALILQSPQTFAHQDRIEVHVDTQVESIDRERRVVEAINTRTRQQFRFQYTKLILAQGGRPIRPDLPGADLPNVFTLWTLSDMDHIHAWISERSPRTAVIAGGGFIGLEMAEALVHRGLQVQVVEKLPHVMAVMDPEFSGTVEEELLTRGVHLHKSVGVSSILPDAVVLENGIRLDAGIVLLAIGVRPTLQLAHDAGLLVGLAGGLLVDKYLRTSDPFIWAAGDMVEIEHRVHGAKVRVPLAGPANRQGRIAAENALGGFHVYPGSVGTSIVRVFDMVAGITGLSLRAARTAGLEADAVTIHKEHHTSYYPGSRQVAVRVVYDRETGRVLGGQTVGEAGADRRLDVIALAVSQGLTLESLADADLAYSPPLGTANDAINMAAFVAQNRRNGFSPSILAEEIDLWVQAKDPVIVDVRDSFAFARVHVAGAINIPRDVLSDSLAEIPPGRPVLVMDESGKKGHQALRILVGAGYGEVVNASGGMRSLLRHARAVGFQRLSLQAPVVEIREVNPSVIAPPIVASSDSSEPVALVREPDSSEDELVVDVRSRGEFAGGAYPGALNIPVDEVSGRLGEFGPVDRRIVVYCASGARSAYAARILQQAGYKDVENRGSLSRMMRRKD